MTFIEFLIILAVLFTLSKIFNEVAVRKDHRRLAKLLSNGSPLLKKLVEEIKKRKITLAPFGLFIEFGLSMRQNPKKDIPLMVSVVPQEQKSRTRILVLLVLKVLRGWRPTIVLPERQIKDLISQNLNIGEIEEFSSHEIGHHIAGVEGPNCSIAKKQLEKGPHLRCLYNELRATEEGLKLIDKIFGIQNWRIELHGKEISKPEFYEFVSSTSKRQCLECLIPTIMQMDKCPKAREVSETDSRIKQLLS